MTRIQFLAIIAIAFFVLAISGIMFLETYEDHVQKLFFSNFGQPSTTYYKLHFSFWPDVFFLLNRFCDSIPWYEVFLSLINIVALFLCVKRWKNDWFTISVFVLAILIPQLIFLNYTRVAIFAATVSAIGILQSKSKKELTGYILLLLIAASIRWQLSLYTILIVLPLYISHSNSKRIGWLFFIAVIPIYMYIQNTSPEQISFHKTEPYIFSLNDSKNEKSIPETDTQLVLIKEMTTRFIIPERIFINEYSLSKISYKTFFGLDATINIAKNATNKLIHFHHKPFIYLLVFYAFMIASFCVLYVLKVYKYGTENLIRISLSIAVIVGVIIMIRAVFYVIYPSLFIILIYILDNDFIKERRQKITVLTMCVLVAIVNILYSFELRAKVLPNHDLPNNVYSELEDVESTFSMVVWDPQSIIVNFKPIFKPIDSKYQNYLLEEPYFNILSQVPNNNFKNYADYVSYISRKSVLVVDKERFGFINKYLKTFYQKDYNYSVIESFPYEESQKVNKVNSPYFSDTTIMLIKIHD